MSAWSAKRKFIGFSIVGLFLIAIFFIFITPYFEVQPTCFDGIQNGQETGVDCGGNCLRFCSVTALPLVTRWSRSFEVVDGRYNAIALVENQNVGAAIMNVTYEFRLYDEDNIFIGRRTGATYILPNNRTAIFTPAIMTGDRVPTRTDFIFTQEPVWLQTPEDFKQGLTPAVSNIVMADPFTNPNLRAQVTNNTRFTLRNFDVVAILYNAQNNIIDASTTFIEELPEGASHQVFFTWQQPFNEEPVRIEILPQVNVFELNTFRSI